MDFRFDIIYEYRWMFLYGVLTTLGLTVVATAGGSVLGLLLALARLINPEKAGVPMRALAWVLRKISFWYVTLFRGTPLFVQIVIWAYVWFPFFVHPADGVLISGEAAVDLRRSYGALIAGSLALVANSGAYICEIFRAGIQSIDKGQMEAGRALGLSYSQTMRKIIVPQAIKNILPALVSEFITLLKETSIIGFIGGIDLLRSASIITSQTYRGVEPLLAVGFIYLILTSIFTVFMRKVERGLKVSD